jgi:sulfane dehydrogenase subunit SoxC
MRVLYALNGTSEKVGQPRLAAHSGTLLATGLRTRIRCVLARTPPSQSAGDAVVGLARGGETTSTCSVSSRASLSRMANAEGPVFVEADRITRGELQLATRNHGMPLEGLRYPITPVGLHYLLIHYDIADLDPEQWCLEVDGAVERPLRLSLDDLRAREASMSVVTMECAGNGRALLDPRPLSQPWLLEAVGTAAWSGVPVASILEEAGVHDDAVEVVFTGADRGTEGGLEQHYQRSLPLPELGPEVMLAYEMNGAPLLPQHGAPLRLLTPGWYGMTNVKWLVRMTVVTDPFTGYQHERAYRLRADESDIGTPLSRVEPRALMVPPGIPDFLTRHRTVPARPVTLTGRAWSGWGPIADVEVSIDDGGTWRTAQVEPPELGPWAWQSWAYDWDATPGEHVLCCRATDRSGRRQADRLDWNMGGYAAGLAQRVLVTVSR